MWGLVRVGVTVERDERFKLIKAKVQILKLLDEMNEKALGGRA